MKLATELGLILTALAAFGARASDFDAETAARLKWFTDARFGMFIHFGSYSLAARHEWVKSSVGWDPGRGEILG